MADEKPDSSKQMAVKYKFRDLKVHSSDEWLADGSKKYRTVFNRYETTFMRVEFSFFNKLFDEEDWEATIHVRCYQAQGSTQREICSLPAVKRKVAKDENIVYFRDSWGNATPGVFWMKGNYVWEAFIDNVKVGEAKFYIEDVGKFNEGENPFFDIESIKLFEGDSNGSAVSPKKYLSRVSSKETRYLWAEFCFKNKTNSEYYIEVFFNFCDDTGLLKGKSSRVAYIPPNTAGTLYDLFPAWGSDTPGAWKNDRYTLEVVFLDTMIAMVPFTVADTSEEGILAVITDQQKMASLSAVSTPTTTTTPNTNLDDILHESMAELNSLTGLATIKQEVNEMIKLVRFYQESGKDIMNKFSLHTVFTGNPGTGKTTVARILSKIYKGLGILEKGHLVEVDRQGLVAGYVGQTAIKTGDKINEAMGGILFIDEAYSLANEAGAQHDFGGESIQVILKRMEDNRGKFGVIVAGYTENMQEFINSNPGLRSRFDKYFFFEDYGSEEMYTIALSLFAKEGVKLDEASATHLKNYFNYLHQNRDRHFGNARSVRQVVGEVVKNQNLRLASMKKEERTKELMEQIILDDVKEFEIKEADSKPVSLGFRQGKR